MTTSQAYIASIGPQDPALTSAEWIILNQLDPKFRLTQDRVVERQDSVSHKKYTRLADQGRTEEPIRDGTPLAPPIPMTIPGSSRKKRGGFAIASILPFALPILSPLIVKGVEALFGLFKKKPAQGSGDPDMAPIINTAVAKNKLQRIMEANEEHFAQIEAQLKQYRGKAFWRELTDTLKQEIENILPRVIPIQEPELLPAVVDATVKQIVPRSMQRLAETAKAADSEASAAKGGFSLESAAKAKAKWVIRKLFDDPKLIAELDRKISALAKAKESKHRAKVKPMGGSFLDAVTGLAGKFLSTVLSGLNQGTANLAGLALKFLTSSHPSGEGPYVPNARGGRVWNPSMLDYDYRADESEPEPPMHPYHAWKRENPGGSLKQWMIERRGSDAPSRAEMYERAGIENARRRERGEPPLLMAGRGKKKAGRGSPPRSKFVVKML